MDLELVVYSLSQRLAAAKRKRSTVEMETVRTVRMVGMVGTVGMMEPSRSEATEPTEPIEPIEPTELTESTELRNAIDPVDEAALRDDRVQLRLKAALQDWLRNGSVYNGRSAETFVARTTVGAWLAVQAVQPLTLGIEWPALLYVCWCCVDAAFRDAPEALDHRDALRFEGGLPLISCLRGSIHTQTRSDHPSHRVESRLLMAAEIWSCSAPSDFNDKILKMFDWVVGCKHRRLALEGVLFNARRASALFV